MRRRVWAALSAAVILAGSMFVFAPDVRAAVPDQTDAPLTPEQKQEQADILEEQKEQAEQEYFNAFEAELDTQLDSVDTGDLDMALRDVPSELQDVWGGKSVKDMVETLAIGGELLQVDAAMNTIWDIVRGALLRQIGMVLAIVALSVLSGILSQMKASFSSSVGDIAGFVCYAMAMIVAVASFGNIFNSTREAMSSMVKVMNVAFPPLLVLLSASGATASAGVMQPVTAVLTTSVATVLQNVLLPLTLGMGVLSIIANFSPAVQLGRAVKVLKNIIKWGIGALGTLYIGIASLQGIISKSQDGLSVRAARFALDKFIPYVGGMLSGSVDVVASCSELMKNALGICSVLIGVAIVAMPLIQIAAGQLTFNIAAAIIQPLGDERLSKGLDDMSNVFSYLFAIAAALALMFIITVGLIIGVSAVY